MKTKNNLTSRQWRLYEFLKEKSKGFDTQQMLLFNYENWNLWNRNSNETSYGYYDDLKNNISWNNMSSARALRKDLKALRDNDTIQKIIVGTKLADTEEEAKNYLDKKLARILRQLKTYHKEKVKLEKHLQTRLVFNKEKEIINALNNE